MKKKLARVLSLALAVCMMASCGSKAPAAPSEPAEPSTPAATEPAEAEEKVLTIGNQYTLPSHRIPQAVSRIPKCKQRCPLIPAEQFHFHQFLPVSGKSQKTKA